jgi:putative chitinase
MITPDAIVAIAPAARPYAVELVKQCAEAGIMANPKRASMFLGQVMVESAGFRATVESFAYKPQRLLDVFRGRNGLKTLAQAQALVAQGHEAVANHVYGGEWGRRNLGNTEPGDGYTYRGRGLKQITGRDNYRAVSRAWQGDTSILDNPDRVADPDGAVASAIWFWMARQLNAEADRGTVSSVTRIVNGGQNGLAERELWTKRFREAWEERADFSRVRSSITSTETPR